MDQQVAVQRILLVALEAKGFGVDLQQPVNGFGFHTCRLLHPLGGASGRSAEQQLDGLGGKNTEYGIHNGGLANTGAAGDDQHL
jgi:hypothetical protein